MKKKSKKKAMLAETPTPAFTLPAEYRPAPTNFKAVEENGCVTLSWDTQPDAVSYNIWRNIGARKAVVIASTQESSYIDSDLVSGLLYGYSLHSRNEQGFSTHYAKACAAPGSETLCTLKVSLNKKRVIGGASFKLTLTLDQPAPEKGTGIALTSDSEAIELPTQIILESGKKSTTLEIKTKKVSETEFDTISINYGYSFQSVTLFIDPPKSN